MRAITNKDIKGSELERRGPWLHDDIFLEEATICYLLVLWRYSLEVQLLQDKPSESILCNRASESSSHHIQEPSRQSALCTKGNSVSPAPEQGYKRMRFSWVLDSIRSLEMIHHCPGAQESVMCNPTNIKVTTSEKPWWWDSLKNQESTLKKRTLCPHFYSLP